MSDIAKLIESCNAFYNMELKRHNDASHPLNVLQYLLDNNLVNKNELSGLNETIMKNDFCINANIPTSFGGTGECVKTWMMCDYPLTVYTSIKLANGRINSKHKKAIAEIASQMEINGWRCSNKGNIGKFRGPGRKDDECPIATLNVLKLLTTTDANEYFEIKNVAIETVLNLWKNRTERKPYLFGMGTDFKKIKYPMIWYDILNVVNVLSHFPSAIKTKEFKEMYQLIMGKVSMNGFIPESVYQYWKGYDFGQKKVESEHIKNVIENIEKRIRLTIASTMTTRPDTQSASLDP